MRTAIAFDKGSVRTIDQDGHLHVAQSNISRAAINPYLGNEIPDFDKLGLDPQKVYKLFRDPAELEKAAPTFNGKPLLFLHKPLEAKDHDYDVVVGAISNPVFEAPFLKAELVVWPGEAIDAIESEVQKELSSAYRYRADMTPGTFEGEQYDGVMRDIVGNHVALVKEGRAGSDVVVGDAALPQLQEIFPMPKAVPLSRKAAVVQGALMIHLRPKLAKDAKIDLTPVLAGLMSKNFKDSKPKIVAGVKKATEGKLAKDATIEDVATLLDSLDGVDPVEVEDEDPMIDPDDAGGMDADPAEALRTYLKTTGLTEDEVEKACSMMKPKAMDADETPEEKAAREKREKEEADKRAADADKEKEKDMVSKPAMDAAIKRAADEATRRAEAATMKRISDIRIAERAVFPLVGTVTTALDSAAAIYEAALRANDVKTEGVDPSAFPAMVDILVKSKAARPAATLPIAADSSALATFKQSIGDDRTIRVLG